MKGSRKQERPDAYSEWLSLTTDNWTPTYRGMPSELKIDIRNEMIKEQRGLCVYCGRRLALDKPGKSYHIEHFRPQRTYPDRDVDYFNLFLSCGQEDSKGLPAPTCGSFKASWFDEQHNVYPAYPDCTDRFRFLLNGTIEVLPEDIAAKNMIVNLKLDHPELKKDREDVLAQIDLGTLDADDFWDSSTGLAEGYAHVVFQHQAREIP